MSNSITINESISFQMYLIYVGKKMIFFNNEVYQAK